MSSNEDRSDPRPPVMIAVVLLGGRRLGLGGLADFNEAVTSGKASR